MTNKDEMISFLQSSRLDQAAAYAQAGRKHAGLSLEALNIEWTTVFRAMAAQPFDHKIRAAETEYECEFQLRGAEPPYYLVIKEVEILCDAAGTVISDIEMDDPERLNEVNKELEQDLAKFRNNLKARS